MRSGPSFFVSRSSPLPTLSTLNTTVRSRANCFPWRLQEGAHALRHGLLRPGEEHVHAEALEEVEPLGEPQHERDAGRVVVLAGRGGGEGDVEQQRDVDDQRHGGRNWATVSAVPLMPPTRSTQQASRAISAQNIGRSGQVRVGPLS